VSHRIYLSLGSNVAKERNLPRAVDLLTDWGRLEAVSPVYETQPVGLAGATPDEPFLNAAVLLLVDLTPEAARLEMIARIEAQLGRVRDPRDRNAPRTIDIDISLWDDQVLDVCGRPVPDPDILRYLHVAQPLADIAPEYRHPQVQRTLAEIAAQLRNSSPAPQLRTDVVLTL
jgi:2-amino-4-hydroxy-6-hydroxymethyldihydropteridine diphosphokinase